MQNSRTAVIYLDQQQHTQCSMPYLERDRLPAHVLCSVVVWREMRSWRSQCSGINGPMARWPLGGLARSRLFSNKGRLKSGRSGSCSCGAGRRLMRPGPPPPRPSCQCRIAGVSLCAPYLAGHSVERRAAAVLPPAAAAKQPVARSQRLSCSLPPYWMREGAAVAPSRDQRPQQLQQQHGRCADVAWPGLYHAHQASNTSQWMEQCGLLLRLCCSGPGCHTGWAGCSVTGSSSS